jgi:hypothetical protein
MAVAVRCTGCRNAAQVGDDALGMLVQCPVCQEPFLALEEAAVVRKPGAGLPSRAATPPAPRKRVRAEPVHNHNAPQPVDGPQFTSSNLPVSVLFGFALLPLAIPLLWLIGPQILGKPPALTLAAPAALAIAASVLCLAVVLTVDWSPLTRIKGVLILVGLSYFAGLSLYFLKKEVVERVREFFTPPDNVREQQMDRFTVMAPESSRELKSDPLPRWKLTCREAKSQLLPGPQVTYQYGSGPDRQLEAERWVAEAEQSLMLAAGLGAAVMDVAEVKSVQEHPGRQWTIRLPDGTFQIVRLFRVGGIVYYLSASLDELDDEPPPAVKRFFESFKIKPVLGK